MDGNRVTAYAPLRKPPLEIAHLARTSLSQLANLPAEGGVYLAVDDANRVWYVGIAESVRERLAGHDRLPDFKDYGVSAIAWKGEPSPVRRRALEKELIEYCHPPLNKHHNFNALPSVDLGLTPDEEIERYLRLRIQYKLIELELEMLKPNIVTRCEQSGGDKIQHLLGTIYRQSFKSWQYSKAVDGMKEELRNAQQLERQNGTAKVKAVTISPVAKINSSALVQEVGGCPSRS